MLQAGSQGHASAVKGLMVLDMVPRPAGFPWDAVTSTLPFAAAHKGRPPDAHREPPNSPLSPLTLGEHYVGELLHWNAWDLRFF